MNPHRLSDSQMRARLILLALLRRRAKLRRYLHRCRLWRQL
jgi:hypothetical protein